MNSIQHAWCCQIDISNYCFKSCLYCSRYNSHLRKDQRQHMSIEQFIKTLDSLIEWPKKIGIIGGEPLLHPDFPQFCIEIQKRFPKYKMQLWTSGPKQYYEHIDLIKQTFGDVAFNEHNEEQLNTCRHQPLTISIKEAVPDKNLRDQLIDDCWVQRQWCPTTNHFGSYFCEVAAAQDVLLNDGKNAWKTEPGWWKKTPEQFKDQVEKFCENCGMCIPMERDLIKNKTEKFTPKLLKIFQEKNLSRVSDSEVELFTHQFTKEELQHNIKYWSPANYRGDLYTDEIAPEGRGFTRELK